MKKNIYIIFKQTPTMDKGWVLEAHSSLRDAKKQMKQYCIKYPAFTFFVKRTQLKEVSI